MSHRPRLHVPTTPVACEPHSPGACPDDPDPARTSTSSQVCPSRTSWCLAREGFVPELPGRVPRLRSGRYRGFAEAFNGRIWGHRGTGSGFVNHPQPVQLRETGRFFLRLLPVPGLASGGEPRGRREFDFRHLRVSINALSPPNHSMVRAQKVLPRRPWSAPPTEGLFC